MILKRFEISAAGWVILVLLGVGVACFFAIHPPHLPCATCKGSGSVTITYQCEQCRGTGIVEEKLKCQLCNGTGLAQCTACNGTGQTGWFFKSNCATCNGTGRIACKGCSGGFVTKKTPCVACGGRGSLSRSDVCPKCKGATWITAW